MVAFCIWHPIENATFSQQNLHFRLVSFIQKFPEFPHSFSVTIIILDEFICVSPFHLLCHAASLCFRLPFNMVTLSLKQLLSSQLYLTKDVGIECPNGWNNFTLFCHSYAIGGLAGGEDKDSFWRVVAQCTAALPEDKPRYVMVKLDFTM